MSILLLFFHQLYAQHSVQKLWETDSTLQIPESVLFVKGANNLYVSNINGKPGEKDGNGYITLISTNGKIENIHWVTGLHAPKGMGLYKNKLYVADIDAVAVINIATKKIEQRIEIPNAVFLNDIAIDSKGNVFVSDTKTGKVHKITNNVTTVYVDSLKSPNGLLCKGSNLYVLSNGSLYKYNQQKKQETISIGFDTSTDGIEADGNNFIVSCWSGIIYYVNGNDGTWEILLNTKAEKSNTADIGYDEQKKIIYVPTFFKNKVAAYKLK